MLFDYLKQVRRMTNDQRVGMLDEGNLTEYVNRARREVAMRTFAIRVLTPVSGAVVSVTMIQQGVGYTANAVAVITPPDFPSGFAPKPNGDQALAIPIVQDGQIVACDISYGGSGYYQPQITFNDLHGVGASAQLNVSPINIMSEGQEVYPFSSIDLSASPGVASIIAVKSVSVLYANWRYSLACPSFSSYQAALRSFPFQYKYVPFYMAQYGRGTKGSFFMYPQPSGPWQMEWDTFCLPSDLEDDQSVEALPEPFTDAVPFMATYFAYLQLQNLNAAKFYDQEFSKWLNRHAVATLPGRVSNPYGRLYW
jgi:hypothetical protein